MNYENLREILKEKFRDYVSTLKETSFDSYNKQYLCFDEEQEIYNFDDYVKKIKPIPASPDAIFLQEKKLYFIEFKNSYYKDIDKKNIKNKFREGALIIQKIIKKACFNRYQFIFCLVHKKNPKTQLKSNEKIKKRIPKKAEGLKDINKNELGNFYDKIVINDINFFKTEFKKIKKDIS